MAPPVVRELWEIEELVEEILIRTPPEEPAVLIRASLACKAWCSLLSGHAFRSRYRTLHKTPPILGFLQSWRKDVERFVPVKNFRPRNPNRRDTFVLDCRHGRVLVACEFDEVDKEEDEKKEEEEGEEKEEEEEEWEGEEEEGEEWEEQEEEEEEEEKEHELKMVVWDPVSGSRTELPDPDIFVDDDTTYSATVLCAAEGCNHGACNSTPFLVAFIADDDPLEYVWASVYSSAAGEWTSPIHMRVGIYGTTLQERPGVLVGRALYVLLWVEHEKQPASRCSVLKYDFDRHDLSVIDLPELCEFDDSLLISSDDGGLGVVQLDEHGLCLIWLMEVSLDGVVSWIQLREMDLKTLVPFRNPWSSGSLKWVGRVEGASIILVITDLGLFAIDLKSQRLRKLSINLPGLIENRCGLDQRLFEKLFLYTSFNNPPAVAGVVGEARAIEAGGVEVQI